MNLFKYNLLNEFYDKYDDENLKINKTTLKKLNCYNNQNAFGIVYIRKSQKNIITNSH